MKPIVSQLSRIRHPKKLFMMDNTIIDDFCYISVPLHMMEYSHIASNCTLAGGTRGKVYLGNFSCLASGVRLYVASDDFVNDIATALPEHLTDVKNNIIVGNVTLGNLVTIGANSVVFPNNIIPTGVTIGAGSLVPPNFNFEEWSVYGGFPKLKKIKDRNKENVLKQVDIIKQRIKNK